MFRKIKRIMKNKYLSMLLKVQTAGGGIERCGNGYGGFLVAADILDALNVERSLIVYSFGIGEDLSFSQDLLKRWNCDIYAFDPTPKAIAYVRQSHLGAQDNFHFYEWGISDRDGTGQFHLPKEELYVPEALVGDSRVEEVSGSVIPHDGVQCETIDVEFRTLKTIMKQLNHQQIDLLKMDIEGAEFAVIDEILNSGVVFRELCLEIHNRFFPNGYTMLRKMIKRLNEAGFYIAGVAPDFMEITFIYKH